MDGAPLGRGGRTLLLVGVVFVLSLCFLPPLAYAQREPASVTLGLQVGQPGGLTIKLYRQHGVAYDGLLTADGEDFIRLFLHRLWERPLPDSLMHVYYGPGAVLGARRMDDGVRPEAGLSTNLGLNFYADRFEVFIQATPTVRFFPAFDPSVAGSVGLRYDLQQP